MPARNLSLSCALGSSDLNRAMINGDVQVAGVDLHPLTLSSPERHWRMFRRVEFDIAEVSFGAFLAIREHAPDTFVAIPAFPHRRFRHSFLFVGRESPVESVVDLNGGRIGLRTWTNTAGVWTKGILSEHHGLDLSSVQWVLQDDDTAGTENLPSEFRIEFAGGDTVVEMTARGELDALIYPEIPDVLGHPGGLRRLFRDSREEEQRYFASTRIFPIMHTVVLRGSLVREHPWLPYEVLRAFRASKDRALVEVQNPRNICLAWARDIYEQQVELMGVDPWTFDVPGAEPAVETLVRYAFEQGIISEAPRASEIFHSSAGDEPPAYVRR